MNEILLMKESMTSITPKDSSEIASSSAESERSDKNKKSSSGEESDDSISVKRLRKVRDVESEGESPNITKDQDPMLKSTQNESEKNESSSEDDLSIFKKKSMKSRIKDSSSNENSDRQVNSFKEINESRTKIRQNKLKQKFSSLQRGKDKKNSSNQSESSDSSDSENGDMFSIENIKKKIEEHNQILKSTIYDPDTSDDERAHEREDQEKKRIKNKKQCSPKPVARMSAKQAMENMKKIKSESNRMLREKEVSLPYHRPKALNLKDIMARRKPATSADGKALPLKMNEEQLKQYAKILEERQKSMMELCKSESEDELHNEEETYEFKDNNLENTDILKDTVIENHNHISEDEIKNNKETVDNLLSQENIETEKSKKEEENMDISVANDNLLDSQTNLENKKDREQNTDALDIIKGEVTLPPNAMENKPTEENSSMEHSKDNNTEVDSQMISLHYTESEKFDSCSVNDIHAGETKSIDIENQCNSTECNNLETEKTLDKNRKSTNIEITNEITNNSNEIEKHIELNMSVKSEETSEVKINELAKDDAFEDFLNDNDDMNMDDIDRLIENAEIIEESQSKEITDSPMLIRESFDLRLKPKLTGAPGMVIDLDGTDPMGSKKQSGIELLKQRFVYFAKLKTPEELEKQARNRINPGTLHLKLKQELEEQIAEQRSLEWAKRLEEEKQQQAELNAIRGDDSDDEQDLEKLEAKLQDEDNVADESSEPETEPEENDVEIKDKPRQKNALLDDEAEESENEGNDEENDGNQLNDEGSVKACETGNDDEDGDDADVESSNESSSDDEMEIAKPKKGRIIKAFEDSDEENDANINMKPADGTEENKYKISHIVNSDSNIQLDDDKANAVDKECSYQINKSNTEADEDLQSAQLQKSTSEDVFTSQENEAVSSLSINHEIQNLEAAKTKKAEEKIAVICETQPFDEGKFDDIIGLCSGSFSQNLVSAQTIDHKTDDSIPLTNEINTDLLDMCTGRFYDNQFVTQPQEIDNNPSESTPTELSHDFNDSVIAKEKAPKEKPADENLQSILEELNDPEFDKPKQNKFFTGSTNDGTKDEAVIGQTKRRFLIDSDDEESVSNSETINKKRKKKKLEQRALHISDDEESEEEEIEEEYESALEDQEDDTEKLVEYDSEENEVEVSTKRVPAKKSKARDFLEQEAELTSEDEWAGSGDEDEAGLDRMEREAGDDEEFHQGALQKELGKIHMREMLDQDKREVRMIQELLLEDGDLGGGHRQRKFRWKNADGEEELGSYMEDVAPTQELEEEQASEEQWRRQRHERDTFLRQMMSQQKDDDLDAEVDMTYNQSPAVPVKTNLSTENAVTNENAPLFAKKPSKDIPSPVKKPFALLQQNSRGSILSRGSGALARLAALATPLAGDSSEDTPKTTSLAPSSKRSFVFTTLSPSAAEKPKLSKRKAENIGTPNLMKKLKTDEKPARTVKSSLIDHFQS